MERNQNPYNPTKNTLHFRYRILFTLRKDGERQKENPAHLSVSVLIMMVSTAPHATASVPAIRLGACVTATPTPTHPCPGPGARRSTDWRA